MLYTVIISWASYSSVFIIVSCRTIVAQASVKVRYVGDDQTALIQTSSWSHLDRSRCASWSTTCVGTYSETRISPATWQNVVQAFRFGYFEDIRFILYSGDRFHLATVQVVRSRHSPIPPSLRMRT